MDKIYKIIIIFEIILLLIFFIGFFIHQNNNSIPIKNNCGIGEENFDINLVNEKKFLNHISFDKKEDLNT